MGRIGKHIKTIIDKYIEQVVETRLNYNQSALTYAASGDDSPPLKEDRIILVQIDGTGRFAAVGVLTESQGAKPGEKILFSRDENGETKAIVSLLNDGKIKLVSPDEISAEAEKAIDVQTKDAFTLEAKKDVKIKGDKMDLESTHTTLKGGKVQCNGTAPASGRGPFCGIPVCPVTGAPHIGNIANNC